MGRTVLCAELELLGIIAPDGVGTPRAVDLALALNV